MTVSTGSEEQGSAPPSLATFESWPPERIRPLTADKTVVLSTSGTSRWYFLEHGDVRQGYDTPEQFGDYGRRVVERTLEIVNLLFEDGIRTVLVVGFGGGQGDRNAEYRDNLRWVYELLVDEAAQALYAQYGMGVLFRGDWGNLFEQLGAEDLTPRFHALERQTTPQRDRWLIWYVPDDLIPPSLIPLVAESIRQTGRLPDARTLTQAYYGRPLHKVDILIGNNKPGVSGICPPLLTLGDLYYTVSPITYLERPHWRRILYDHLYARRGHYREYRTWPPEVLEELRDYYTVSRDTIIGLGEHHAPSQTWRPLLGRTPGKDAAGG